MSIKFHYLINEVLIPSNLAWTKIDKRLSNQTFNWEKQTKQWTIQLSNPALR